MQDFIGVLISQPALLYMEVSVSFVLLVISAKKGPHGALNIDAQIDQLAEQVAGVFWKIVATLAWAISLMWFPKETLAQWVAFIFSEAISAVSFVMMLSVASQYAVLGILKGYRAPEDAWETMRSLSSHRLVFWYNSLSFLLRLPFAEIPDELRHGDHWKKISLDAQNRKLDRDLGIYRSKYTNKADRYNKEAVRAIMKAGSVRAASITFGFILAATGILLTSFMAE